MGAFSRRKKTKTEKNQMCINTCRLLVVPGVCVFLPKIDPQNCAAMRANSRQAERVQASTQTRPKYAEIFVLLLQQHWRAIEGSIPSAMLSVAIKQTKTAVTTDGSKRRDLGDLVEHRCLPAFALKIYFSVVISSSSSETRGARPKATTCCHLRSKH